MTESPQEMFGRLKEAAAFTGFAANRAQEWWDGVKDNWQELGFQTFDDFIGDVDLSMAGGSRAARLGIEQDMAERGAPLRAIGNVFGINASTVLRDLKSVADATEEEDQHATDQQEQETDPADLLHDATAEEEAEEEEPLPGMPAGQDVADEILGQLDEQLGGDSDEPEPEPKSPPVMLTLFTHTGEEVLYPKPASDATFNESKGEGISWAAWSWNPVTGCLHGCDYCYARAIANRWTDAYPAGFTPVFHHDPGHGYTRLDAPANTVIPAKYRDDEHESCGRGDCQVCAYRRVFVCSMADLYGRWVPDEWIQQVHASMLAAPWWQYILLTKFPARYVGLDLPPNAWVGTSVDEQKRVRIAEDAFRKIDGVKVKWLSLEPLNEPLEFTDLSMFDWVVIGAQTETRQPDGVVPARDPERSWVYRITAQALEAGCDVHWKPNLKRAMAWPDEYPEG